MRSPCFVEMVGLTNCLPWVYNCIKSKKEEMMMKKLRIWTVLLAVVLLLVVLPGTTSAEEITDVKTWIAQLPDVSDTMGTEYYFYNQLSDVEKVMYWKMTEATWENPIVSISGLEDYSREELRELAANAWSALGADAPELHMFWTRWVVEDVNFEGGVYSFTLVRPQATSEYLIRKSQARIQQIVETVGKEGDLYSRTRDLLELMHREMDYDWYYVFSTDTTNYYNDSAIGCFVYNTAICAGFSDSVKILCDELDIPCIVVGNNGHAWNFIQMEDGKWYSVDASADSSMEGNGTNLSGRTTMEYATNSNYWNGDFCLSYGDDFSFPELAECAYEYPGTYTASYHQTTFRFSEPAPTYLYRVNPDGISCTITGYQGSQSGDLIIPEMIDGYTVTEIGEAAFYHCVGFTGKLILPPTVKVIHASAFKTCTGITGTLSLPEELETIGAYAFLGNENITGELDFPESLQRIDRCAFWRCYGLTGNIVLPDHVALGDEVFGDCTGLTGTLYLPANFTWNGNITNGTNITAIQVSSHNQHYSTYDGVLYTKDGKTLLMCPSGKTGTLLIPEGVEVIARAACYKCDKLSGKLVLPQSLREIGAFAFEGAGFTGDLVIPENVETIGEWSFSAVPFGGQLTLSDKLVRIEDGTFWDNQFVGILSIPDSVVYIGDNAFYSNDFSSVIISNTVETIGRDAFFACQNMESLIIGGNVGNICEGAFRWCNALKTIYFAGSCPVMGENCFELVEATAYYPQNNRTWSASALQQYGGTIGWEPYELPDGWIKEGGKWYYYEEGRMKTGWIQVNGVWYYLDSNGAMQTGWEQINGKWYYLDSNGAMQTGWVKVNGVWYYLDASGVMQTGWQHIDGKWYYLNSEMQTGWQHIDGKWYYLAANGAMQTGWQHIDGKWYYLNSEMQTGWQHIDGKWYYLNSEMKTGWQHIDGKWYYLNSEMKTSWQYINGKWYYLNSAMHTGWLQLGGKWYYLGYDGAMVTGTQVIGGVTYYFDANGIWIP